MGRLGGKPTRSLSVVFYIISDMVSIQTLFLYLLQRQLYIQLKAAFFSCSLHDELVFFADLQACTLTICWTLCRVFARH